MPAYRFFLNSPLERGSRATLDPQESRHLIAVMRARPGDWVEIVNGQHQLAKARIEQVGKKEVIVALEEVLTSPSPIKPIILCQGLPSQNRLDAIVEKGTELGMHALWLFPGEKSERKGLSSHQLERLRSIAIAAMKQCGRLDLPTIEWKGPLSCWESLPGKAYFGDIEGAPFKGALTEGGIGSFVVGPESGLSASEKERLKMFGAEPVSLHTNILRTDTAALAALTLLSTHEEIEGASSPKERDNPTHCKERIDMRGGHGKRIQGPHDP